MAHVATLSGRSSGWFHSVEHHDELDSSNTELLRRHAAGLDIVGTALLVDHQTAGRGRAGRTWLDDGASTLMLSVGVSVPSAVATLVPLAVGLAVADTVDGAAGSTAPISSLKWPNDVEIERRKVAGVLVEAAAVDPRGRAVIVAGMGVNLGWRGAPPAEIAARLTTVERATGRSLEPTDLVGRLVDHLAVEGDGARGAKLTGDGPEQRRLARTVGPDDGHTVTLLDVDRDVEQGLEVAVEGVERLDPQHRGAHRSRFPR